MKFFLAGIILAIFVLVGVAWAVPGSFESVTVSSTAVGFTSTSYTRTNGNNATTVTCSVETDAIRIRYDGTSPTATVGVKVASGSSFTVRGTQNIATLKMIRVTADATVQCMFE